MNKTAKTYPKPLATLVSKALDDVFKRQGFASREIVTRWQTIVGTEIANVAQPVKMQWPRPAEGEDASPATLVLRVEGPAAIEIQHQSALIIERVNQFFGWYAVERLALRQAPLVRPARTRRREAPDPEAVRRATDQLPAMADEPLRNALGRLGAAVKRK